MLSRLVIILSFSCPQIVAQVKGSCQEVRLADIGWTDVTSTTAIAVEMLRALKYTPKVSVLSTPVTLAGLKNGDIDVFLGNWMPTQESDVRSYLNEGTVAQLRQNLAGARFTLAVPKYVYDAGVKTFSDLDKFRKNFSDRIYGIEAGNDGNRLILHMLNSNAFGLKDWHLVESSEQGMLAEVSQKIKQNEWIVFLAWAPHPMNIAFELAYLDGGDKIFGPNFGASKVYTLARKSFAADCPPLAQFFKQLVFNVEMENQIMQRILHDKMAPEQAAQTWLLQHPDAARAWLKNLTTFDGRPAPMAFDSYLEKIKSSTENSWRLPLGDLMANAVLFLTTNFSPQFRAFSHGVEYIIKKSLTVLLKIYWPILIFLICASLYFIKRSLSLVLMVFVGLLVIVNLGLWTETIQTLVLVLYASAVSILVGIPVGIWTAHNPRVDKILRPLLDLMQTIPTFVYLIPTLMLFGLGLVPGLISTVIFAVAAPIRLTCLGLKNVPPQMLEAADAFGATKFQRLVKVEIPAALPSIMAGLNQCIMLSLSMVVIAALVGADGLGTPVVRALNTVNVKQGFEAGLAIVILAILLDRTLQRRHS